MFILFGIVVVAAIAIDLYDKWKAKRKVDRVDDDIDKGR